MKTEEYIERINILTPKIMKSLQFMYPPQIKEIKLSLSQAIVLICLFEKDRMSMGELAQEVYLNLSSLTKITDSLIKENMLKRERDENDRRKVFVSLSKRGKNIVEQIREYRNKGLKRVLDELGSEKEQIISGLEKIIELFWQLGNK